MKKYTIEKFYPDIDVEDLLDLGDHLYREHPDFETEIVFFKKSEHMIHKRLKRKANIVVPDRLKNHVDFKFLNWHEEGLLYHEKDNWIYKYDIIPNSVFKPIVFCQGKIDHLEMNGGIKQFHTVNLAINLPVVGSFAEGEIIKVLEETVDDIYKSIIEINSGEGAREYLNRIGYSEDMNKYISVYSMPVNEIGGGSIIHLPY